MNTLANFRTAIATTLAADSRLANVFVSTHGGDFDRKELKRYAKQTPAVIVSLHHAMGGADGGEPVAYVTATIVCLAKDRPALAKDVGAMQLADACMNILLRFPNQNWGLSYTHGVKDVRATNAFSEGIDTEGVAMWIVGWTQGVNLQPTTLVTDQFATLQAEWDLAPRDNDADLGDVIEAEDTIEP